MTIAQSDGESSKSGIEGQQIKQTHHLIKLPAPHHSHFVVSVLHLTDSYFVWCGETPHGAAAEEEAREFRTRSQMTSSPLPQQQASALSAEEEAALATLTEEERRQIEVDRRMDEELANALQAAGRQEAQQTAAMPKGFLAREWAVAMQRPSRSSEPTGTSIFRTSADVAAAMSRRLARSLDVSQLHLSLSLPPELTSGGNLPAPPGSGSALLALEMGIEQAIKEGRLRRDS